MTRIRIVAPESSPGSIDLDGLPVIAPLSRITFDSRAGTKPTLFLETVGDALIEADCVVVQRVATPSGPNEDLAAFLADLDPDQLEAAVLAQMENTGLGETKVGTATVAALQELARART